MASPAARAEGELPRHDRSELITDTCCIHGGIVKICAALALLVCILQAGNYASQMLDRQTQLETQQAEELEQNAQHLNKISAKQIQEEIAALQARQTQLHLQQGELSKSQKAQESKNLSAGHPSLAMQQAEVLKYIDAQLGKPTTTMITIMTTTLITTTLAAMAATSITISTSATFATIATARTTPTSITHNTTNSSMSAQQPSNEVKQADQPWEIIEMQNLTTHLPQASKPSELSSTTLPQINHFLHQTFEGFAQANTWGSGQSISGAGSEVAATSNVKNCLSEWISKYSVKVFLDIPCGDGNWQGAIPGIESVEYWGFDISETAVERAQQKNLNRSNMHFGIFDLTSAVPMNADLILVRDVLQHLPLDVGKQALRNAQKAGVKWLAVSTYPTRLSNRDIRPGQFFYNNVQAVPYKFGKELEDCQNYSPQTRAPQLQRLHSHLRLFDLQSWKDDP